MPVAVETNGFAVADPTTSMTGRQLELLALYASGVAVNEIAAMKFLSPFTVRNTLTAARERVEARSLTHLCVLCVDHGLIVKQGDRYVPVQDERVVSD